MSSLFSLFKDLPVSAALGERIKIMDAEIDKLRQENIELKEEKANFLEEITQLRNQIADKEMFEDDFSPHAGVLFKKGITGDYDKTIPYCPKCEVAMFVFRKMSRATHKCSLCGFFAPFTARQLKHVTKDL